MVDQPMHYILELKVLNNVDKSSVVAGRDNDNIFINTARFQKRLRTDDTGK